MAELTPPDLERCQCDKPGPGPFALGGELGDPNDGYRVRCRNKPTVIITERQPGEDGQCGSMSLCPGCLEVFYEQMGRDFADVQEILPSKYDDAEVALREAIEAWRQVPARRRGDIVYWIRAKLAGAGVPEALAVLVIGGATDG